MIPAIIDQECADALIDHMRKNIVVANPDITFKFLVNVDDYRRKGCLGTVETICDSYSSLKQSNCTVDIVINGKPLGLTVASRELFKRFLETDFEYLVFFDDDCVIINPVYFNEFINMVNEDYTFHLAFAYDNISVENPFITNDVYLEGQTVRIFKNSRVFCTENGTIFTKNMVRKIINEYTTDERKFNTSFNPEDVIGALDCYKCRPVLTVAFKNNKCVVVDLKQPWRLPKENHFIVDSIRHFRIVGWNK